MDDTKTKKYSRQILLSEISKEGQEIISEKKVAIVGLGALGSVAAELLCRAGIGSLLLIDRDVVEESNLQRQILYTEKDVGKSKALAAQERLQLVNSLVEISAQPLHLNLENITLLRDADLVLDCTDNLQTRFLINDFCKKEKKRWIYAAAIRTSGYVCPFFPEGPCLRCFLEKETNETCDTVGVLNTIIFSIASQQVTTAIKVMFGKETDSILLHTNIWQNEIRKIKVKQNPSCPTCNGAFPALHTAGERVIRFCATGRYQILGNSKNKEEVKERWEKLGPVHDNGIVLAFQNIQLFNDGRVIIKANSEQEALAAYSKYIGN